MPTLQTISNHAYAHNEIIYFIPKVSWFNNSQICKQQKKFAYLFFKTNQIH